MAVQVLPAVFSIQKSQMPCGGDPMTEQSDQPERCPRCGSDRKELLGKDCRIRPYDPIYMKRNHPWHTSAQPEPLVSVNEPRYTCPECEASVAESWRMNHRCESAPASAPALGPILQPDEMSIDDGMRRTMEIVVKTLSAEHALSNREHIPGCTNCEVCTVIVKGRFWSNVAPASATPALQKVGERCNACGHEIMPKMGPGDYSCVQCGMGMIEPCEHWKITIAEAGENWEGAPASPATQSASQSLTDAINGELSSLREWANRAEKQNAELSAELERLRALAGKVIETRTEWLESYGVPISAEFADFADALGVLVNDLTGAALGEAKGEQGS